MSDSSHPRLQLSVEYPETLSRGLVLIKWWLLAIPHFIVLLVFYLLAFVVTVVGFFAILFTGKYPEGMWNFALGIVRWWARVEAYVGLLRDEYPPFSFDEDYPVRVDLQYPTSFNRFLVLVKWLLIIPHMFVLNLLGYVIWVVWLISLFAILFTGRIPRGLFDFTAGYIRWSSRAYAYYMLLTDDYPPFSFDNQSNYTASAGNIQPVSYG